MIYALVYCLLSVLLRFLQENDESDAYSIILWAGLSMIETALNTFCGTAGVNFPAVFIF